MKREGPFTSDMATRKRDTATTPADGAPGEAPAPPRRTKRKATPAKKAAKKGARKAKPKASAGVAPGGPTAAAGRTTRKVTAARRATKAAEPPPACAGHDAEPDTRPAHAVAGGPSAARTTEQRRVDAAAATSATAPRAPPAPEGTVAAEAADFLQGEPNVPPALEPAPLPQAWRRKRVVFIDVENTSSEASVSAVLDRLDLDGLGTTTEIIAIGNWRVISQTLARSLAARGAQLVHSAPAVRVRDWSDLWIAVQAGIWLGRAHAGDAIDIVSHDRAFDAVGDAARRLGVAFRRITYADGADARQVATAAPGARSESGGRRRAGRRRGRGTRTTDDSRPAPAQDSAAMTSPDPAPGNTGADARLSAPADEIEQAVARLTADDPLAGIPIDRLGAELQAAGFHRPPGSPRLVTRLKRLKDIEVLPNGWIRLAQAGAAGEPPGIPDDARSADGESPEERAPAPRRRSRRRGGRRRSARSRQEAADGASVEDGC